MSEDQITESEQVAQEEPQVDAPSVEGEETPVSTDAQASELDISVEDMFAEFFSEEGSEDQQTAGEGEEESQSAEAPSESTEQSAGGEEAPVEEEKTPPQAASDAGELAALKAELAEMKQLMQQAQKPAEAAPEKRAVPEAKPVIDLFGDDFDFDNTLNDKDAFKGFINNVVATAKTEALEEATRTLPALTLSYVQQQQQINTTVQDFYKNNPDLENASQYVGFVANQIKAQRPEIGMQELLEETASKVRNAMGLQREAKKREAEQQKAPRMPAPTSGRPAPQNDMTAEEQEIFETLIQQ